MSFGILLIPAQMASSGSVWELAHYLYQRLAIRLPGPRHQGSQLARFWQDGMATRAVFARVGLESRAFRQTFIAIAMKSSYTNALTHPSYPLQSGQLPCNAIDSAAFP
jgi:hypothetical protein